MNTPNKNEAQTNEDESIFNQGMFGVITPTASYNVPVFNLIEDEKGATQLNVVGAHTINFLRNDKEQAQFMLMGLFETENGTKWGYNDSITEELVTFDTTEELIIVPANLMEEGLYLLDLEHNGQNAGIKVKPDGVMRQDHSFYSKEQIAKGQLDEVALIYAKEIKHTIPGQEGIIVESLLRMIAFDLEAKYEEVPSVETIHAITKIKEAIHWLTDRTKRNVVHTNDQ